MIEWLVHKGIPFEYGMLKPTLYSLIQMHKPREKKYSVDEILNKHGHSVLRLPPYHPELNPIEKIWANVKQWVSLRNTVFTITEVRSLCEQRFSELGQKDWLSLCDHVKKIEAEYWESDGIMDEIIDNCIISLGGPDSDSESEMSDNQDEDDDISGVEEL